MIKLIDILKEEKLNYTATKFLDALKVVRNIPNLDDITVSRTVKGNWMVFYKNKKLTIVNGNLLDDSTIMKYQLEKHT